MIELSDIKVSRNGKLILELDSLCFEDGQSYALIGENGSGKTTLLRLLGRIIKPSEGKITGLDDKKLAYLPQKPYLFRMPVWQNVALAVQESTKNRSLIQLAIDAVGMHGFERQEAEKLSGGEAQRVAIARLLLVKADLVLLDEPTAPVDLRGREQIDTVIADYVRENNATLIFATHSLEQAMKLADRVIKLEDGVPEIR
jgi:ABC-type multidrug transport system ATPase subunit